MGWGDEIMVTAQARRLQLRDPRRVVVVNRDGSARWHPIWENNPRFAKRGTYIDDRQIQMLANFPGHRPYLDYKEFRNRDRTQPYVYTNFRVEPGEIYLSPEELKLGELVRGAVILEPNVKPAASPNKDWGWERWERLARELRGLRLVQLGPVGTRLLRDVEWIQTDDIRQACGVLSGARLLISPEGGLHHAAAAMRVPAVVIFGGFISPATTGYALHTNLYFGEIDKPCGMRVPCAHCAAAMARITPELVVVAARVQLEQRRVAA